MGKRKAPTTSALKPTSIRIREDLHRRATILAYDQKSHLQTVVNDALEEYLKKHGA